MVTSDVNYCNSLLVGLPYAPSNLYINQPKRAHVTPLLIDLRWPRVAAQIKFESLVLAYRVTSGSAPTYLNLSSSTAIPTHKAQS